MADHAEIDHTGIPGVGSGTTTTTVATDTIWDAAGDLVQGTGANTAAKLSAGSAGKVLTSHGAAAALTWETPGGGGGIAQSFIGYNTVGGTFLQTVDERYYNKKVTLASAAQVLSVDVYCRNATDNFTGVWAIITADNSNAPGVLLGLNFITPIYLSNTASMPSAGRWLSIPCTSYLAAGDYWLGVAFSGTTNPEIAKDGSGSDQYFTLTGSMKATGAYTSAWAITTSTDKYSIRASILS